MNSLKKYLFNQVDVCLLIIFLGLASSLALIGAYISQYIFGYQPCILCLYQRVPFFIVLGFVALSFLSKSDKFLKIVLYLCLAVIALNFLIAFYHVGVEFKIFVGLSGCSGASNLNSFSDLESLRSALENQPAVKCDEPQFYFLGLTMAFWNMIYCLFLFILVAFIHLKSRQNSVKKIK